AVGHHGHVLAGADRARELTQGVQSAARRRPAHDVEPEAPREVRHQLAVARAAGQHAHAPGALAPTKPRVEPRHDEDAAVPDGVDQRAARLPEWPERIHAAARTESVAPSALTAEAATTGSIRARS